MVVNEYQKQRAGSITHPPSGFPAITSPRTPPPAVASINPQNARARLSDKSAASVPSSVEYHSCAATIENGGNNITGVTWIRAAISQRAMNRRIETAERHPNASFRI